MKSYLSTILLILSVILSVVSISNTTDRYSVSELQLSEADYLNLKENRIKTDQDHLEKININGFPLLYDEPNARWFFTTPEASDSVLTADFSSDQKDLKIAFYGNLIPGNSVQMIAYTDLEYREYTLAITTLPLIHIECETTAIPSHPYLPMKFTLFENNGSTRHSILSSEGTIHVRGNATSFFPKKPYRITLSTKTVGGELKENETALLGLRRDDDWLLYPAYNDQEKIRNVFSSNLWFNSCADNNSFGLKFGMEYRYTELFLNHKYWGLYALGYPIDAKQVRIQPEKDSHYEEFLFKQRRWGPEHRDISEFEDLLRLQFAADDSERDYGYYIMQLFFEQFYADFPNGMHNVDEKNAIDIWLFTKLIQPKDTISHENKVNNIIYLIKLTDTGRKILFAPWDMDATWGNIISFHDHYKMDPNDNSLEMKLNPVTVLLKTETDSKIATKIKQRYAELRAGSWSNQAIFEMLDGFEQNIYGSGAYLREMERWPKGEYRDPEEGLSRFRAYVQSRFTSMDEYIDGLGEQK